MNSIIFSVNKNRDEKDKVYDKYENDYINY